VFDNPKARPSYIDSISIPEDPFVETTAFAKFQKQVKIKEAIETFLYTGNDFVLSPQQEADFIAGNPNGFLTYYYLGNYYEAKENWAEAIKNFEIGLTKNVAKVSERKFMEENLAYCKTQLHD
jgi:tetratricopeptide (TPR) repeat protein